eukprot:Skav223190  [mRNA]  locus=scaffold1825:22422:23108:- [translate_table: standard]
MVFAGDGLGDLCAPRQPPQPLPIWDDQEPAPRISLLAEVEIQKPEETWRSRRAVDSISSKETFVVEPDPIFTEGPSLTTFQTDDTVSRRSFDSWTVPTLADPQPPANRVLHEAYVQEMDSFMHGVGRNPTSLKKLIKKSRGELADGQNWFDSLGGGTERTSVTKRFLSSIRFFGTNW